MSRSGGLRQGQARAGWLFVSPTLVVLGLFALALRLVEEEDRRVGEDRPGIPAGVEPEHRGEDALRHAAHRAPVTRPANAVVIILLQQ